MFTLFTARVHWNVNRLSKGWELNILKTDNNHFHAAYWCWIGLVSRNCSIQLYDDLGEGKATFFASSLRSEYVHAFR